MLEQVALTLLVIALVGLVVVVYGIVRLISFLGGK